MNAIYMNIFKLREISDSTKTKRLRIEVSRILYKYTCAIYSLLEASSTDFSGNPIGQGKIPLGVDLGHVGVTVSRCDVSTFKTVLCSDPGRVGMPQLQG